MNVYCMSRKVLSAANAAYLNDTRGHVGEYSLMSSDFVNEAQSRPKNPLYGIPGRQANILSENRALRTAIHVAIDCSAKHMLLPSTLPMSLF